MTAEIRLRTAVPDDAEAVAGLFALDAAQGRDARFWRWINLDNVAGAAVVVVAELGGSVIGHYSVLPMRRELDGSSVLAGLASQAFIHPERRSLSLLLELTGRVWEECARRGVKWVYGFPNDNIWSINLALMEWRKVMDFQGWSGSAQALADMVSPVGVDMAEAGSMDGECLAEPEASSRAGNVLVRDSGFARWRFVDNPRHGYVALMASKAGCRVGRAVLKLFRDEGGVQGDIVDLHPLDCGKDVVQALLRAAGVFFLSRGAARVNAWAEGCPVLEAEFLAQGFARAGRPNHLGVRAVSAALPARLLEPGAWRLTMADSDVY